MQSHPLIHNINKLVLHLNFRFQVSIRRLHNSLCTPLITCIRMKRFLMIEMLKIVNRLLGRTRTSLCKQECKQCDFLANGADFIDRRET